MNKVHIRRINGDIYPIVDEAFESFGIYEILSKVKRVSIKPNLVSDVPEYIDNGCNTDVRVIEAVLKCLSKCNTEVTLVESETGTAVKGRKLDRALEYMGIYELQKKYNFKIVNLTNDEQTQIEIPGAKALKKVYLSNTILESDLIINLPKLKTHKYATMTCALKNMFGVVPDPLRVKYHHDIHQVIADLNSLFWNKMFVVVDGIRGMEGNGPIYGTPVDMNILMFADNPLYADITAAEVMDIIPDDVKHIKIFNEQYVGLKQLKVEFSGEQIDGIRRSFKRASKNWFVKLEGEIARNPIMVRIVFSNFFRRHVTFYIRHILKRLRGGSFSWYDR